MPEGASGIFLLWNDRGAADTETNEERTRPRENGIGLKTGLGGRLVSKCGGFAECCRGCSAGRARPVGNEDQANGTPEGAPESSAVLLGPPSGAPRVCGVARGSRHAWRVFDEAPACPEGRLHPTMPSTLRHSGPALVWAVRGSVLQAKCRSVVYIGRRLWAFRVAGFRAGTGGAGAAPVLTVAMSVASRAESADGSAVEAAARPRNGPPGEHPAS